MLFRTGLVSTFTLVGALYAGAQPCVDSRAAGFPCDGIELLSFVPLAELGAAGSNGSDLWGWTDSETGREFVLFGLANGTAFVEITNPSAPVFLGHLPAHSEPSPWRDIKVSNHHAYIVSEATDHGLQVFDLLQLRDVTAPPVAFTETIHYAAESLSNAHNIVINEETDFAYIVGSNTCNGGLHMVDIEKPRQPRFAGCFVADGYTHDAQPRRYGAARTAADEDQWNELKQARKSFHETIAQKDAATADLDVRSPNTRTDESPS